MYNENELEGPQICPVTPSDTDFQNGPSDTEACCEHCHECCHFIAEALSAVKVKVKTKKLQAVLDECIMRAEACCENCCEAVPELAAVSMPPVELNL